MLKSLSCSLKFKDNTRIVHIAAQLGRVFGLQ